MELTAEDYAENMHGRINIALYPATNRDGTASLMLKYGTQN